MNTRNQSGRNQPGGVGTSRSALEARLRQVSRDLVTLNRELASQMILLSEQTDDPALLMKAVEALRKVQVSVSGGDDPRETADVHHALARALYALGRRRGDREALSASIDAFRAAITLASLLGDDDLRLDIRAEYDIARASLSNAPKMSAGDISALRVA